MRGPRGLCGGRRLASGRASVLLVGDMQEEGNGPMAGPQAPPPSAQSCPHPGDSRCPRQAGVPHESSPGIRGPCGRLGHRSDRHPSSGTGRPGQPGRAGRGRGRPRQGAGPEDLWPSAPGGESSRVAPAPVRGTGRSPPTYGACRKSMNVEISFTQHQNRLLVKEGIDRVKTGGSTGSRPRHAVSSRWFARPEPRDSLAAVTQGRGAIGGRVWV